MSGGQYGGEDINALVFDIGSANTRVGYAGDFEPKCVFPTAVGFVPDINKENEKPDSTTAMTTDETKSDATAKKTGKYYVGHNITLPIDNMEVVCPVKNGGLVENFEGYEQILSHAYHQLNLDSGDHPMLLSEAPWNTKKLRHKQAEMLFETFKVPALQIIKTPVLSLFSQNRHSGLVIDIGATHASAIPVYEGNVVTRGIIRSPFAGDFIIDCCRRWLQSPDRFPSPDDHANLWPLILPYQIQTKTGVLDGKPPIFKSKNLEGRNFTDSWRAFQERQLYSDFAAHILHTSDRELREQQVTNYPQCHYEFPNGYNTDFGSHRYQIPEFLFDPSLTRLQSASSMMGIPQLMRQAYQLCDADLRNTLCANIHVTGGCSSMNGFIERMTNEVTMKIGHRTKIIQTMTSPINERRYSAWMGGSILGSLGSFHQHWITKAEWDEVGPGIFEKKCVL